MARDQAESDVQQEDDRVRITHWRLPPDSQTGWHVHHHRYIVVPVQGGMLTVEDGQGSRGYELVTGVSYSRPKGVEHNIANDTDQEIAFVEIELLR